MFRHSFSTGNILLVCAAMCLLFSPLVDLYAQHRFRGGKNRPDLLRFMAGRKMRLNQALSVPSLSLGFLSVICYAVN